MNTSPLRYLVVKVLAPSILINAVAAAIAGVLLFRSDLVPLRGTVSVFGDTMTASFLIGFLTTLGIAPMARLEARAGRVRAFGTRSWKAWTPGGVLLSALVFGIAWVVLLGLPAVHAIDSRWPEGMPRTTFVGFKTLFGGAAGTLAALVAAIAGLAAEKPVALDARWAGKDDGQARLTYPCGALDKSWLAFANRVRGCSPSPTWAFPVRGSLDPAHIKQALADVAVRYPTVAMKVQSIDGVPPAASHYRYAADPSFSVDQIFDVVEARDDDEVEAILRKRRNRHIDLFTDFPLWLTLVRTGPESCHLVFTQHHAIADGRAFIDLLLDFAAFLNDARAGRRPTAAALAPIHRRSETDALELTKAKQARYSALGFGQLVAAREQFTFDPPTALFQNKGDDYTGDNATVFWVVDDSALKRWNQARKHFDVSQNTLLAAALLLANQRVHRAKGHPLGKTRMQLLMETRPRKKEASGKLAFASFANHLASLVAEVDLQNESDPRAIMQQVQKQVVGQIKRDTPIKRLLGERWLLSWFPLDEIQRVIYEARQPFYNLNFSNMTSLEFPDLRGDGWVAELVLGTTPVAPRDGVVLIAVRYHGKVVFNFNYKATVVTREYTEELRAEFEKVLEELIAASARPAPAAPEIAGAA
jgi:hypothetical protein